MQDWTMIPEPFGEMDGPMGYTDEEERRALERLHRDIQATPLPEQIAARFPTYAELVEALRKAEDALFTYRNEFQRRDAMTAVANILARIGGAA